MRGDWAPRLEGAARGHLAAIDVVRFLTIGGVILVHSTSFANSDSSLVANGVLQLAHVTRSVFLMLSGFVLTYSYLRRPLGRRAFWWRRYPLILVPYVTWSAIYFVADGEVHPTWSSLGNFVVDLSDAHAHFHLYFLLLTMQLYLVFPALMAALRRWPKALTPALVVTGVVQLAFTGAAEYGWRPPVLGMWFEHPSSWLFSYSFYVVGGVAAAAHFDAVSAWVRSHYRLAGLSMAGAAIVGLGVYAFNIEVLGYAPIKASAVFQPANVIEVVAATLSQFALGMWLAERASAARLAWLERSSDVSFGVYLAHPLLLSAVLDVAVSSGLSSFLSGVPSPLVEVMIAFGMVPFLYAVTFVFILLGRRSRLSLALTGRRSTKRPATAASASAAARDVAVIANVATPRIAGVAPSGDAAPVVLG
ncbi:MAG: acyltransferase [Acidimicrobiales bacterium]